MVYALAVGLVMTLAGFAAEQSAWLARRPAGYFWMLAMVCTAALPLLPWLTPVDTGSQGAWTMPGGAPAPLTTPTPTMFAAVSGSGVHAASIDIDRLARLGWQRASGLACASLLGASLALHRRRRQWRAGTLAGSAVLVSADAGPAVVAILHPQIVVPAWLLQASPSQQALMLAHEQSHIAAGRNGMLILKTVGLNYRK